MTTEPQKHWFAPDGSYGSGLPIVTDTTKWTEEDWREIEDTSDDERIWVAFGLAEKYKESWKDDES